MTERFVKIRKHFQLNQVDMAAKVNKSTGSWQSYEQGARTPGSDVMQELYYLGININWLLSGKGEMLLEQSTPESQHEQAESIHQAILDDSELEVFMNMPSAEFWDLFNRYGQISPVQSGWTQLELIKRFPEFRRWLKKQKEIEQESSHIRQKIA